jgi:hypothetical protein
MKTLQAWAREKKISEWAARRLYDAVIHGGVRVGLYRLLRPADETALDAALQSRATPLKEAAGNAS